MTGRIGDEDAERQLRTVEALNKRLATQAGVILADEVGMGKTFVALGVAIAAALSDRSRRPVVVMVPPSLHQKWPREFEVFRELALRNESDKNIGVASARTALDFLRLIDNPVATRPRIIFLKHGAFLVHGIDHWVRFALIKCALHGQHLGERRAALPRFAADILRVKSYYREPRLFERLLASDFEQWKSVINDVCHENPELTDDPVPHAVQEVLGAADLDLGNLREALRQLPARESSNLDQRLESVRAAINAALKGLWPRVLAKVRFRSPLLILDEAHHLKNPATRLSSLFVVPEAREDAHLVAGALDSAFERMLFLTATPFQLGHRELLNVLGCFRGVNWRTLPPSAREDYESELSRLSNALNAAHVHTCELDSRWASLSPDDLIDADGGAALNLEQWWTRVVEHQSDLPERVQVVMRSYEHARHAMKEAESLLRKFVVRHLRDRRLPGSLVDRRLRRIGSALHTASETDERGLPVSGEALLPFLLAARAQAIVAKHPETRAQATFAEGLASSYEAFLHTRAIDDSDAATDEEELPSRGAISLDRVSPYLERLARALPSEEAYRRHPKIGAVIDRVVQLWSRGEKVVVFCHYRATGRALVKHISRALEKRLWSDVHQRLGLSEGKARRAALAFGERFDHDSAMRRPLEAFLDRHLHGNRRLESRRMFRRVSRT